MAEPSDFRYLVVPHTHWDREWYLPFEAFRLRLGAVVDGVLDTLERDPSFTSFTLDGQAIVLEDYVEVRPENEDRLRALLAAGRLEAGAAHRLHQLLVRVFAAEHLAGRVPHRGEDDRAGVADGAVEVEENGLEAHAPIVSGLSQ